MKLIQLYQRVMSGDLKMYLLKRIIVTCVLLFIIFASKTAENKS